MTTLFFNAKIIPVTSRSIDNGYLLVRDGKIAYVGEDKPTDKADVEIDAKGGWLTPGLIDCHSHLGGMDEPNIMPSPQSDVNEMVDPITPNISAEYTISPHHFGVDLVREAGFTTLGLLPGSANIIGGHGVSVKLRGKSRADMIIPNSYQMKMALGENPKRCYGGNKQKPMTRMQTAAMLEETLQDATTYMKKRENEDESKRPDINHKYEPLVKVLKREMRVRIHCHRADDMETAVEIGKKFNLDFTLEHATEGHMIADYLAKNNVKCILGPILAGPVKRELWRLKQENAAILIKAGVDICISADGASNTRWLPGVAGVLLGYGLSFEDLITATTINPAKVLELDDKIGSLDIGKCADIAIFNANPFHNYTRCRLTMIDGEILHNTLSEEK